MDSEVGLALAKQLEPLCEITGLTIVEPIYECQKRRIWDYTYYYCEAILKFSEELMPYSILLDKNKRVFQFVPLKSTNNEYLLGYDLLPPGQERQQVLDTVERVNATLGNRYFGKGAVQKAEGAYIVSFLALPEKEIKKRMERGDLILDPYFTFFLTEDMTVYGVYCGGWCFSQMEKEGFWKRFLPW
jgi:hypothetical protein